MSDQIIRVDIRKLTISQPIHLISNSQHIAVRIDTPNRAEAIAEKYGAPV
jgi:hypothetical protein